MNFKYLFFIALIFPTFVFADFPDVEITNSGHCLAITSFEVSTGVFEYIDAPSPFSDDDRTPPVGFPINSGTCDATHSQTSQNLFDGTYTFTGASSGSQDFYVIDGLWYITPPSSDGEVNATSTIEQSQQNMLLLFFVFCFGIIFSVVMLR